MKTVLRIIGLIGVLVFGTAFVFTYALPAGIEKAATGFIKERIEAETGNKIDSLSNAVSGSALGKLSQKMLQMHEQDIAELKAKLKAKAYEQTAAVIAEMQNLSCECRIKYAQRMKEEMELRLSNLETMQQRIMDFMKSKYMEIVAKLNLELRIFTGTNLAMFTLLLLASFMKPGAVIQLFVPGLLLATSTIICTYFYLFKQNWFFSIIYSDYLGFWYLAYVGGLFLWFCDIIFNKARVTTEFINGVLNAIGSALQASPC
ncbi:MAG: hypothetical protein OEZ39_00650 [Gammaproteobacteria bacterium]|nr:hypothetical protein [Gammaproteobacteria bacterium]MDH5650358.1 hypothetical protein [Gammaproteobacteria bacterium]